MQSLPQLRTTLAATLLVATSSYAASLEITVDPVFRGEQLRLDSLRNQNASSETFSVTRLSYLLSGFAMERDDGQWVEFPDRVAWMDAGTHRNTFALENIPPGKFRSIRFYVGPDAATNAADVSKFAPEHPLNPNLNGLHWSWQGGYIFMAVEGFFQTPNAAQSGYAFHLARDQNRTRINLAAPIDLTTDDGGLLLHLDLATLFNVPRPLSFVRDGTATHSREGDPVADALVTNLRGAFSVSRVVSAAPAKVALPPMKPIDLPEKFTPYRFTMSRTFPMPDLPRDNPLINERVALGKKLFNEKSLSRDGTISCATCHQTDAAFTDRLAVSNGVGGGKSTRNAMPLFNLAWKKKFFWDGRAESLREQVLMPIQDHREMDESLDHICEKLTNIGDYPPLFRAAFRSPGITAEKISLALEQFLLTISAHDSKFDQALDGKAILTDGEKRGFELFMTEYEPRTGQFGADCFHCHGGPLFSDHQFHNNGLNGSDPGRGKISGLPADERKFSTPSLRNVSLTGPYMHDGRFSTLEEVVEHYSSGMERSPTLDPNLAKHPGTGLNLSTADKDALVAFLKTLTDERKSVP